MNSIALWLSQLGASLAGGFEKNLPRIALWLSQLGNSLVDGFEKNLIREDRWLSLLRGLGTTVEITVGAIILGTILGIILCLMKISSFKPLNKFSQAYIRVFRGTPVVVQLLIIYFGFFGSISVLRSMPKVVAATIAFGLNSAAYIAELLRGGIMAVDKGQVEAGRSLGLSAWQTMRSIVLPQGIKIALPTYTQEFIALVKETAIAGYIAIEDLTKKGDIIRSRTFSPWYPLLTVAIIYLVVTTTLELIFGRVERRLRESDKR